MPRTRHETMRARARSAGAGRHPEPQARPAALHAVARRRWRHPRRPDGDAARRIPARRQAASSSSTPRARTSTIDHIAEPAAGRRPARRRRTDARCWRCRGPRPPACSPALPRCRQTRLHDRRASRRWRQTRCSCHALRLYRRGRLRDRRRRERDGGRRLASCCSPTTDVQPIGLGARDSLRLEAGLCLYGHDIDTTTSPIEAGLAWSIQKRRRIEGGFPGAARIQRGIEGWSDPPACRHQARRPRAGARGHRDPSTPAAARSASITSGGFGPTVNGPDRHGLRRRPRTPRPARRCNSIVRGKPLPATVVAMPFVPHRYKRGK